MDERIIRAKLDTLRRRTILTSWPVGPWQVREADYTAESAYEFRGDWRPLQEGETFAALTTVFCRASVACPAATTPTGKLCFHFPGLAGVEGLLRVDGQAYAGLDANHDRVPALASGAHALELEFVSWLRAMCQPDLRGERAVFKGANVIEVDPDVEAAYYDLRFVAEAIPEVTDERRKKRLAAALEEALLAVDLTLAREDFGREVQQARAILAERLAAIQPDPEGGKVCLVGHTHIDTAWLWPLSETVRKCGRTFSTAARLMEQYPDFHFACSQAQLYQYTKERFPELYEQIKGWVATGRWETTGAMWVESDCNVPSGEALIRQMLYGLAFFRDEFGTRPRVCWLPDVFGYPASLPSILAGCGIPYFMTCKLHWQSQNPFPSHLFWWEGTDGARVLAHVPKLLRYYNGTIVPQELRMAWENFKEKGIYDEVMLPFGYGDGGGGVTPEMMEYAAREKRFPGLPATRVTGGEAYFDTVVAQSPDLPAWVGELYLETHRGTYTTQGRTKRANRKSELLLRDAEIWGSWAGLGGQPVEMAPLHQAWERVLLQQFHDILPGSSIGPVYEDNLADLDRAQEAALGVRQAALRALADGAAPAGDLVVFNSLSWSRSDPVEAVVADPGGAFHLRDAHGRSCPVQVLSRGDGQARILFEPYDVPAMGYESYTVRPGAPGTMDGLAARERGLENAALRAEFDDEGNLVRLLDKRCGREVISPEEPANLWQLFQDGPEREAAWNVHDTFEKRQYGWDGPATIRVIESGPVRAALLIERARGDTQASLRVELHKRLPRLDFVADVDWQERQTMLKLAFPVQVRSTEATCEIQFGTVQRPTHRNTTWDQQKFEICAHHWVDLSEGGYGVSLLNDGRFGHDVKGNMLRLTALRGPEYPDPQADLGDHHFVYALYPHAGDWREGGTARRGWELNAPMTAVVSRGSGNGGARSLLEVEGSGVVVTAFKPAEDGDGWVLRLYEAHGGRGPVQVRFAQPPTRAVATNLVEEPEDGLDLAGSALSFEVKPYEIKTFRLWWR